MNENSLEVVEQYWDTRPCNIRHSDKEVGTLEYFEEVEKRKYFVEPHIPTFADFQSWREKRVLEIGCGIGTDAINFAKNGAIYTGIELSEKSLDVTRQRFNVYSLESTLLKVDAENCASILPMNNFDLIYSFGVVHHSPNPRRIIENARQLIYMDGELRFMVYAENSWKKIMIDHGFDQPEAQFGCPIAYTYSRQDIEKLLDGLFEVTEFKQDHIFPYKIDEYKSYQYVKEKWFSEMPTEIFKVLEKNLGWHLLIKARPI